MIKFDWFNFIYDHVWFGWYITAIRGADQHRDGRYKRLPKFITKRLKEEWAWADWSCAGEWCERLWPMREYGEGPPIWWLRLFRRYVRPSDWDEWQGNE